MSNFYSKAENYMVKIFALEEELNINNKSYNNRNEFIFKTTLNYSFKDHLKC